MVHVFLILCFLTALLNHVVYKGQMFTLLFNSAIVSVGVVVFLIWGIWKLIHYALS